MTAVTPDQLRKATAAWRRAEAREAVLRAERDDMIRAAVSDGWSHAAMAHCVGLTRGRVNQIVRGRR
jgi:hypothetical protein